LRLSIVPLVLRNGVLVRARLAEEPRVVVTRLGQPARDVFRGVSLVATLSDRDPALPVDQMYQKRVLGVMSRDLM
jgi:hypothetical protein